MVSFTNINAGLVSVLTEIIHIQIGIDKIYTFLDALAMHSVISFSYPLWHSDS